MTDTTMTLRKIFLEQALLLEKMGFPGGLSQEGAHKQLTAALVECVEALNETNWKVWKPNYLEPLSVEQQKAFATELTDIIQFVVNAAIYMGYTADDLDEALRAKLLVNYSRIANGEVTCQD